MMKNAAGAVEALDEEPWAPLVDVSALPIEALDADAGDVLGRSLRRVLGNLHDRDGVISAFGSFVSES